MIRLVKYLKPFSLFIILAVMLLFVQGVTELTLPDYTAKIVNVGIQQRGIDTAVPEVLRVSTWEKVRLFLTDQEQAEILSIYNLVDAESPDYERYLKDYPILSEESIYVLQDVDGDVIRSLNVTLGQALIAVFGIEQAANNPDSNLEAAPVPNSGFDLSSLPPDTDLFALFASLPDGIRSTITQSIYEQFGAFEESMIVQIATSAIEAEYEAIGVNIGNLQNGYIVQAGLMMLGLSLISGFCAILVSYLSALTGSGVARNVRHDVFKKVEGFANAEFDKFSVSSLITRTTNDITQVQMVVIMIIRLVFYAPILGVGGVIKATGTDASMWWIIAVGIFAISVLIAVVFVIAVPKFRIIQSLVDRLNLVTRENLSGMMVIRAFNKQAIEEKRFDDANKDLSATALFIGRVVAGLMPMMMLIMNSVTLLVVWVGSSQVANSSIQVGDVLAFMQYGLQVMFAFLMLTIIFILLPRASVSANRIADVLETELSIIDPENPKPFKQLSSGTVEFRGVSFRYPDAEADVLSDINFIAKPGQTTAFIGSTGSGKSTLINLIPRFYDVTEGSILIDGVDIREVTQHDLREQIGYVPQKALLFTGTIDSNLRYGVEDVDSDVVTEAIRIAQAKDFIEQKSEGLQTKISQGGTNVSGGQRQRLSIARALVKQAPIYIFDDSFSALDYKTDAALRKALRESTADSTLLIVTQRVSTVLNAEQIIVLDQGRIVGTGTHEELMKTSTVYQEIVQSQMGKGDITA
jgi:ATP-binding cassette subfamily B multidrug efflux pump